MIVKFENKNYYDKENNQYKSSGQILAAYKNYLGIDYYARFFILQRKYKTKENMPLYRSFLTSLYKDVNNIDHYFEKDGSFEELEEEKHRLSKTEFKEFIPDFNRIKPINLHRKTRIKNKSLNRVILYNKERRVCAISGLVRIDAKERFTITHDVAVEDYTYFFQSNINYKYPINELSQSKASKYFILLNFQAWILESFGYICTDLFIRYYKYKSQKYYGGKIISVPYVPRLIQKIVIDYNENKREWN